MIYHVTYSDQAIKELKKLDRPVRTLIRQWIESRLEGCEDPRAYGKPLSGDKSGQWRYRIGSYRVLAEIRDDEIIVFVVSVGHRRDVYR